MRMGAYFFQFALVAAVATASGNALAQPQPHLTANYDGVWQVDWRCEANTLNGAPPIIERFRLRLERGQASRFTEGTTPQQVTWRQNWAARAEGRTLTITADGSNNAGVRWQYRQSGQFANPTTINLIGGGFGVGADTRKFRDCSAQMTMLEPAPTSIAAAERRRQEEPARQSGAVPAGQSTSPPSEPQAGRAVTTQNHPNPATPTPPPSIPSQPAANSDARDLFIAHVSAYNGQQTMSQARGNITGIVERANATGSGSSLVRTSLSIGIENYPDFANVRDVMTRVSALYDILRMDSSIGNSLQTRECDPVFGELRVQQGGPPAACRKYLQCRIVASDASRGLLTRQMIWSDLDLCNSAGTPGANAGIVAAIRRLDAERLSRPAATISPAEWANVMEARTQRIAGVRGDALAFGDPSAVVSSLRHAANYVVQQDARRNSHLASFCLENARLAGVYRDAGRYNESVGRGLWMHCMQAIRNMGVN